MAGVCGSQGVPRALQSRTSESPFPLLEVLSSHLFDATNTDTSFCYGTVVRRSLGPVVAVDGAQDSQLEYLCRRPPWSAQFKRAAEPGRQYRCVADCFPRALARQQADDLIPARGFDLRD